MATTYTEPVVRQKVDDTRFSESPNDSNEPSNGSLIAAVIVSLIVGGAGGFLVGRNNPSAKFRNAAPLASLNNTYDTASNPAVPTMSNPAYPSQSGSANVAPVNAPTAESGATSLNP